MGLGFRELGSMHLGFRDSWFWGFRVYGLGFEDLGLKG